MVSIKSKISFLAKNEKIWKNGYIQNIEFRKKIHYKIWTSDFSTRCPGFNQSECRKKLKNLQLQSLRQNLLL